MKTKFRPSGTGGKYFVPAEVYQTNLTHFSEEKYFLVFRGQKRDIRVNIYF